MRHARSEVFASRTAKMVMRKRWVAQSMHRHRPIELVIALDGPISVNCRQGVIAAESFIVPPMEPHAFAAYEGRIARVYLDIGYRRLTAWKGQVISSNLKDQNRLRVSIGAFFESARGPDEAGLLIDDWLTTWLDESESGPPCDPRVTAVLAYLDGQEAPLSADRKGLAKKVGLSPTRLAAIFAEDTGMPLSRYLIWRRVKIALARICAGESVTHAAAEAGFADGAHFTRSCRATYGSSPSYMVGFSIMPISHVAFAEPTIRDQHVCLAPHDTVRSS